MRSSTTLPPNPVSAGIARRWVSDVAAAAGLSDEGAETLQLLASELATNAVIHARSEFTLTLVIDRDGDVPRRVRLEASDLDSRLPRLHDETEPSALGGRGLMLVRALARDFGVQEDAAGKLVWLEFDEVTATGSASPKLVVDLAGIQPPRLPAR